LGILSQNTTYSGNRSWRIENLVFLELLNRYDEVYTYKTYNGKEIDFICLKEGRITYLQVTDILNESNWEREVGNLESLSDSNEKIVLSNNVDTHYLSSGIKIVNLLEWLKS
jgi:predicted AAA+ superfamily ATPase